MADIMNADAAHSSSGPLLDALSNHLTLEEIKPIVEGDPSLLRRRWHGNLPLHAAVRGRPCRPGVVRYLVEQFPESVREVWSSPNGDERHRCLPIHLACSRRRLLAAGGDHNDELGEPGDDVDDDDTIQVLVEAWPGSLWERDGCGRLPLHVARDESAIRLLHQVNPAAIHEPDHEGRLALHVAMEMAFPLRSVQVLTELAPQSVKAKDNRGRIPLHCITAWTRVDAVQHLVEQWEGSAHQPDGVGDLPLHHALRHSSPTNGTAVVMRLLSWGQGTARVRSHDGFLPLHMALGRSGMDTGVIRSLEDEFPGALRERTPDEEGFLPLHLAARAGDLEKVRFLVEQDPESVRERSSSGWLAIHLVLLCRLSELRRANLPPREVHIAARFLLHHFPESVMEATTREGYLPLHVASMTGYEAETDPQGEVWMQLEFVQYLVQLAPAAARVASHELLFPANYAVSVGCLSVATTDFLFRQFPAAILHRDPFGRNALHMAIERHGSRALIVQHLVYLRPVMLQETDRDGSTPLHAAVAQPRPPRPFPLGILDPLWDIARILVEARPQSLGEVDRFGSLPLHVAVECNNGAELNLVRLLVEARPQSVGETDATGQLPLHIVVALHGELALPTATFLVEQRPEALLQADDLGHLPVHAAVDRSEPSLPIVSFLVEQRPQALLVADAQGRIPLHAAVAQGGGCPLELVELLVDKCPESVRRMDANGHLPLMIAAAASSDDEVSLDVLFYLATTYPEAVYGRGVGVPEAAVTTTALASREAHQAELTASPRLPS